MMRGLHAPIGVAGSTTSPRQEARKNSNQMNEEINHGK